MKTTEFLRRVLPEGNHYIAYPTERKTESGRPIFGHKSFQTAEDGAATGLAMAQNKDIYFATASFKVASVLDTKQGYMKAYRKQENVAGLKTLYVDVDYKDYDGDQVKCLNAIKTFLNTGTLVKPNIIVSTGGGYHLYWVLDRVLPEPEWRQLATSLAAYVEQSGLKADLQVTIDSARILRLPGTRNFKYEDRPECRVVSVVDTDRSVDSMRDQLEGYTAQPRLSPAAFRVDDNVVSLFKDNEDLVQNFDPGRVYLMEEIVERCPTLRGVLERGGEGDDYKFWKDTLHLAAFTADGRNYIHALSNKHATYSPESTEERFDESVQTRLDNSRGPTTCKRFSEHSAACMSCAYWGHIKSPISLGMRAEATTMAEGVTYVIPGKTCINVEDKDGEPVRKVVVDVELDQFELGADRIRGRFIRFNAKLGTKVVPIIVEMRQISDSRSMMASLLSQGVPVQTTQMPLLGRALVSWMDRLQKAGDVTVTPPFGWTETNEFVVAGTVYKKDGSTGMGGVCDEFYRDAYVARGEYEKWKQFAEVAVKDSRPEIHMLLATAFATPLLHLTELSAFTIAFTSRESGVGKSTMLKLAQSVWGDPTKAMSALNDTTNAVANKMAYTNYLPSYWDELRGEKDVDDFVRLVFRAAQGKERQRMNSRAEVRKAQEINTMLVAASNNSIIDHVVKLTGFSNAGLLRVFQCTVPPQRNDSAHAELVSTLAPLMRRNYGHAGLHFVQHLVRNEAEVGRIYEACLAKIKEAVKPTSDERFWVQASACLLAGAFLAKRWGIMDLNAGHVMSVVRDMFAVSRAQVGEVDDKFDNVGAAIFNHFNGNVLVTKTLAARGRHTVEILAEPRQRNWARLQLGILDKKLLITRDAVWEYCEANGLSFDQVRASLLKSPGALQKILTLGGGTSFALARCPCFQLDAEAVLGVETLSRWATPAQGFNGP